MGELLVNCSEQRFLGKEKGLSDTTDASNGTWVTAKTGRILGLFPFDKAIGGGKQVWQWILGAKHARNLLLRIEVGKKAPSGGSGENEESVRLK